MVAPPGFARRKAAGDKECKQESSDNRKRGRTGQAMRRCFDGEALTTLICVDDWHSVTPPFKRLAGTYYFERNNMIPTYSSLSLALIEIMDWSEKEIRLIVEDYFSMRQMQLKDIPFSKSEHRRALVSKIGRSEGSIEFKHRNISAILDLLGFEYVSGYLPAKNYQKLLSQVIEEAIVPIHFEFEYCCQRTIWLRRKSRRFCRIATGQTLCCRRKHRNTLSDLLVNSIRLEGTCKIVRSARPEKD